MGLYVSILLVTIALPQYTLRNNVPNRRTVGQGLWGMTIQNMFGSNFGNESLLSYYTRCRVQCICVTFYSILGSTFVMETVVFITSDIEFHYENSIHSN